MRGILDHSQLDITCPRCTNTLKIKVGALKRPGVKCPKCGLGFETSQFKKDIDKLERDLKDFGKGLGSIKVKL